MNFDFLSPVEEDVLNHLETLHPSCLGRQLSIHMPNSFPELDQIKLAIIGVLENRREQNHQSEHLNFNNFRKAFYGLFPGNWTEKIADLGDIQAGENVEDTEFALRETTHQLIKMGIIPLIIGGSQDLTYTQYRAYDYTSDMVNLVSIDSRFDIGNTEEEINDHSYVGKMIVTPPYNLFNFANIGYQSYLNPPEEIELIERLFFEAYRLGNISSDITLAEPVLRDANLISIDINSVSSIISKSTQEQPNGFDGREICALARYAGISDKVTSFGLYNLHHLQQGINCSLLPAEILWYFIEGVNFRKDEKDFLSTKKFLKYSVPLDNETLIFYQSKKSGRWWVEIPSYVNNKLNKPTFLPCSQKDYVEACNQQIPDRWYKARCKNQI